MAPWPRALVIPQLVDHKNAGTIDDVELVLDQLRCELTVPASKPYRGVLLPKTTYHPQGFLLTPNRRQHQIEAHEIHRGKGLVVCLSLDVALRIMQVTVRIGSAPPEFRGKTPWSEASLPLRQPYERTCNSTTF
ncbi:hypothetical protein TNCV_855111 [Trichonephila clavipes]|nr:hypothetical protein TNCV_855111 [Trichonephila clavipes]